MMSPGRFRAKLFSVKSKFTLYAFCIGLVSFGVAAVFSALWTSEEFEKQYREKANLIWKNIVGDLEKGMIFNNHGWILKTLNDYRDSKEVGGLGIFDLRGHEVFSRGEGLYEPRVKEVLKTGEPVHFDKEIERKPRAFYVIPIKNKSDCQSCHGKDEAFTGALLVSLSMDGITQATVRQRQRFFILFALMAIVIGMATVLAANRFFIRPLLSIQKGTEIIERGDFEYQIPFASRDEIGDLARRFNHMARTLRKFLQELEDKNRQLTEQVRLVSLSQKEWQETFDRIMDPICVVDSECTMIKANRAFRETFGEYISSLQNEIMPKKCFQLFGKCLAMECPGKANMQKGTPETVEIRGPNSEKIFRVSLFPYHSPEGEFIGSVLVLRNVTEEKKSEMQLIMSERLAALGQMASGIAHEINNPLATIGACSEGLLKRIRTGRVDVPLFESYLGIIEEELARCSHITTSMLSFVRKRSNRNQKTVLKDVLDRTLDLVSFQGRLKRVEVLKTYSDGSLSVAGNEGDLKQVFLAIIVNALDAMEGGGRLVVETDMEGNKALVKISDAGPGIPPSLIDRIFDPFFTTKSERGGTGLGLSIADKIVKENEGKMEVISEEGRGTTFKITLPLSSGCPGHEVSTEPAVQSPPIPR
jgi:PAS domain S-box-containing protein